MSSLESVLVALLFGLASVFQTLSFSIYTSYKLREKKSVFYPDSVLPLQAASITIVIFLALAIASILGLGALAVIRAFVEIDGLTRAFAASYFFSIFVVSAHSSVSHWSSKTIQYLTRGQALKAQGWMFTGALLMVLFFVAPAHVFWVGSVGESWVQIGFYVLCATSLTIVVVSLFGQLREFGRDRVVNFDLGFVLPEKGVFVGLVLATALAIVAGSLLFARPLSVASSHKEMVDIDWVLFLIASLITVLPSVGYMVFGGTVNDGLERANEADVNIAVENQGDAIKPENLQMRTDDTDSVGIGIGRKLVQRKYWAFLALLGVAVGVTGSLIGLLAARKIQGQAVYGLISVLSVVGLSFLMQTAKEKLGRRPGLTILEGLCFAGTIGVFIQFAGCIFNNLTVFVVGSTVWIISVWKIMKL